MRNLIRQSAWFVLPGLVPVMLVAGLLLREALRTIKEAEAAATAVTLYPDEVQPDDSNHTNAFAESIAALASLESEEVYLQAQMDQVSSKDVSLWIDLTDSTATLAIEGVPVRVCDISEVHLSALLARLERTEEGMDSLTAPFTLASASANIPHIPIRVVEAPKDTAEARLRPPDAFTPEESHVTAELRFDRRLVVYLSSDDEHRSPAAALWHAVKGRVSDAAAYAVVLLAGEPEPLDGWISVRMASNDVRAVYRGLRQGARMAIRLKNPAHGPHTGSSSSS